MCSYKTSSRSVHLIYLLSHLKLHGRMKVCVDYNTGHILINSLSMKERIVEPVKEFTLKKLE
jgi:hypothetical protein